MNVSELSGPALDWAVAKCEGTEICAEHGWSLTEILRAAQAGGYHRYSTNWAQGGPIIEREKITIEYTSAASWHAAIEWDDEPSYTDVGPTPLIAAMRCYVASKLGEEIEIPTELT